MDHWLESVAAEINRFGEKSIRRRPGPAGEFSGTFTRFSRPHKKLRALLHLEPLERRLTPSAVINVNAAANVHTISPDIYGAAFATTAQITDLNLTINREGGENADTYNWQADAENHAIDWYYESIADGPGNGQSKDAFVSQTTTAGAQADLTIPILPYVASLGPNGSDLGSYPVSVYGPQQYTDPYLPNFGNGITPGGQHITDTNKLYNYVANSPSFEQVWIQHVLNTFGTPAQGGVPFFTLGNEPGLWNDVHGDIHPSGETNTELLNAIISYGSMIKSLDPTAQILGPEEWGWTNYFVDGADSAAGNYGATYGGLNVEQWLLEQLAQYQAQHGTRLLDYFTLHYYPQENGVDSDAVDKATELLRNQSTRALWDPNYVDPSWIGTTGVNGGVIDLIPMMQSWVNTYYPGTKTGITEYNFGAEGDMNGATTQADLYGIFGRQGLDLATRWTTPAADTPAYLAMKLWRNYDGHDSGFGDTSVSASVANPDQTDAFAAKRSSDGALTVAVVNKNVYDPNNPSATTSVTVNLGGFANNGVAQQWQLAAVNPSDQTNAAISHLADVSFSGNSFTLNVPMESVTMFVIKPAVVVTPATLTGVEGMSGAFNVATFADPGSAETTADYSAGIDWGDGTVTGNASIALNAGVFTVSGTHIYAEEGAKTPVVTISHDSAAAVKTTASISVSDPSVVATPATLTAVEGASATFNLATFTDPGGAEASDDYAATIVWGDGTTTTGASIALASGLFSVSGTHMYSEEGAKSPVVTIGHDSAAAVKATDSIAVSDPSVIATPATLTAGTGVSATFNPATFTDPGGAEALGDYTATIDWGDGTVTNNAAISLASGLFTVSGTHTYANAGAKSPLVTITDDASQTVTTSASITVSDLSLIATPATLTGVEGTSAAFKVATFTDPGGAEPIGNYSATIDWGDHTSPTTVGASQITVANQTFTVATGHVYTTPGTYTATVTVADTGGRSATVTDSAVVTPAATNALDATLAGTVDAAVSGNVATFTHGDGSLSVSDFQATIDWGDGTLAAGVVSESGASYTVAGSHTYAAVGTFTLATTILEGGVSTLADGSAVIVPAAPPVPSANPDTFVLGPTGPFNGLGATSVLANDMSADGQPQNLGATLKSQPTNGALTLHADGSFLYTPGASFQGIDRFTYQVREGETTGNTVTVTLLSYNASLVDKLYQQVLHRSAEDGGLIYWTSHLDAGKPLDVVATGIFNSAERLNPLVTQLYEQFFGRDTDPSGLAYWVNDWQTKGDPRDVVENILSSQEFFHDAGDTNSGYITLLYQRVLQRSAEPDGLAYWLGLMSNPPTNPPETRLQIASQFYDTHEKHVDLVDFLFGEYFQGVTPLPDTAPYVTDLDSGQTETQVEESIIDSSAYSSNPPQPAAGTVGKSLYPH